MALTQDERKRLFAARLEGLLTDLYAAARGGDLGAFRAKRRVIEDFSTDMAVPSPVRQEAVRALIDIGIVISDAAIDEIAEAADRMVGAGAGLSTALTVLEAAKADLFFPALASASKRLLEQFKTLKAAADKIGAEVTADVNLTDLPQKLTTVASELEDILAKLRAAGKA